MQSSGGYPLSNYSRTGREASKHIGKQNAGNTSLIYLHNIEPDYEDDEKVIEDEDIHDIISSKIAGSGHVSVSNHYARADHSGSVNNAGGLGLAFEHTNPIRSGMSPYKQPKHNGFPMGTGGSKHAWTTGNHKSTGSKEGWSKPYRSNKKDNKKRFFSLQALINDTGDEIKQFTWQKNRVKKIINEVNN